MGATQSMLTQIESYSIFIEYEELNEINEELAVVFSILTLICAFIGIFGVNKYIAKSGK